jgi:hypothetical protein
MMAKRRKASGAGEPSGAPAPLPSEREALNALVATLSDLDSDQLRLQWRNHLGGIAPAHLPRCLPMRVLAYRIQAAAFKDLDRAISRRLRERDGASDSEDVRRNCHGNLALAETKVRRTWLVFRPRSPHANSATLRF